MNKKNAIVIADSISNGNRITSYLLTVPQIIVKELLRHRMFSFSSSSMRAIPFNKVLEDIRENMFVPLAFQSHHSGMQGSEYLMGEESEKAKQQWIESGLRACEEAERLYNLGVTKQLCSRIIEPFGYAKILITATEFNNFFELRCPKYKLSYYPLDRPEALEPTEISFRSKKDYNNFILKLNWTSFQDEQEWYRINTSQAEIHIQALAESMWDAMNESNPKQLKSGEWHLPFSDKINDGELAQAISPNEALIYSNTSLQELRLKACVSRCARLSYINHDGEIDYQKDIKLHDRLLESKHASPMEHCARAMTNQEYDTFLKGQLSLSSINAGTKSYTAPRDSKDIYGWCNNFKGFIQYRYLIENSLI